MRTIITAIILMMLSQPVWAEARSMDKSDMKGSYTLRTICVDGYKFVVAYEDFEKTSVAITQFYEDKNGVALPAKCTM